jgi:hypothetical protein
VRPAGRTKKKKEAAKKSYIKTRNALNNDLKTAKNEADRIKKIMKLEKKMNQQSKAYCSWCCEQTNHELVEDSILVRNLYKCSSCFNYTLECRYCKHMAKGKPNNEHTADKYRVLEKLSDLWDSELCAEHDGTIASFRMLNAKLASIDEFKTIFDREQKNLSTIGAVAAGSLGAIALITPAALVAAPSMASALGSLGLLGAASTGTAISTLSGAALTSASLAAVGGGTMAAGVATLTAAGASLGGIQGARISNSYFGDIDHFNISREKKTSPHNNVIFINGFLSEDCNDVEDWKNGIGEFYQDKSWFHVDWEAKNLKKIGSLLEISSKTGEQAAIEAAKHFAIRAYPFTPLFEEKKFIGCVFSKVH